MHTRVLRQPGMESRRHHTSLPPQHGIVAARGKDLDAVADSFNTRGTDENHFQGLVTQLGRSFDDSRVDLASVSIAADGYIDGVQSGLVRVFHLLRQQNRSRAGPESRLGVDEVAEFVE